MYMNGAVIGMAVTAVRRRPTPQAPHQALPVCFGVVAGSTLRGAAECRIAATLLRRIATATTASASSISSNIGTPPNISLQHRLKEWCVNRLQGVSRAESPSMDNPQRMSRQANEVGGYRILASYGARPVLRTIWSVDWLGLTAGALCGVVIFSPSVFFDRKIQGECPKGVGVTTLNTQINHSTILHNHLFVFLCGLIYKLFQAKFVK